MPLFTISASDKPQSFDLRGATRASHLDWLAQNAPWVKLGGPWLDGEGRSIGSLLIVEAADLGAAQVWAAQDPYALAGLFETVMVAPWKLVVGGFGSGA